MEALKELAETHLAPTPPPGEGWREVYREPDGLYHEDEGELVFAGTIRDLEVVAHDGTDWARPRKEPFAVEDLGSADWALEQIAKSEAQVEAIRLRKQALLANLESQERRHQRRADWFRSRYADQIAGVARRELEAQGGKRKTLTLDHGTIAFRKSKGTTRIVDEEAALEWARLFHPDLVKRREWVTATDARRALDEARERAGLSSCEDPRWIESSGPRETVRIETGLGGGK